ncbi:MAG: hypothetical protein K0R39_949 [Symbiobacteriaceae bacterium]|jgi:hypothetical protein|nr:hypothetical protein [Symbiobacteriaceae bacterium]
MAPENPNADDHLWEAEDLNLDSEPVLNRSTNKANFLVREGAAFDASAVAVDMIGRIAIKDELGTTRPSEILFGVGRGRRQLIGIPVAPDTPGATKITYRDGHAYGTLFPLFAKLDRLVPADSKERYFVRETPAKAKIGEVTGWGFYMDLANFQSEPIRKLTEEQLAKRRATLAAKKAAKEAAAKKAADESAPSANPVAEETNE